MEGPIIGTACLLCLIAIPVFKWLSWRATWKGSQVLGGIIVRFTDFVPDKWLLADLLLADTVITDYIRSLYPLRPELANYRVDVVPTMPDVYGTVVVERAVLLTPKIFIAKVERLDAAYNVAHEVSRHILPYQIEGTMDNVGGPDGYGHLLTKYGDIETEMKRRLKVAGVIASS